MTSSDSTTGFKTTELTADLGTITSEAITTSSAQSSSSTNVEETDSSVTATSLYGTNPTQTTVVDDDGNTMSHPAPKAMAVTEKNGVKSAWCTLKKMDTVRDNLARLKSKKRRR